ncbi:deoxyribodipyrimidine photolyase [Flammeovirga yaeyamensis]|uniref:Deoxyribodipyrimidine photolyase n=1 Tax=Flammeovirga yaeyamensis TaxID=367791 RepID=A0AAX1N677_9BACT|nr:FAD-binding domain-containing protein [Flammeovirga yaeyamensis]MBB3697511.1 deoxyribodipyrimidine photo-lyase [Flammeovirga yaeyamensis]NMF36205.1 deoxyribodipyrimidine photolyase [Flammeovirga yaeyamensis]QWG02937.1 deoxyribodipyrimidine photolyase [Flammeovirga yaeyamensis]
MHFSTKYSVILELLNNYNPDRYAASRNYIDGSVSYLSPYISRGVISTKKVYQLLLSKGYEFGKIEKFVQELAWRDYWQQLWVHKEELIDDDLKRTQPNVAHYQLPISILEKSTGIDALDHGIDELEKTGYMHNHMRMYISMLICNIGQTHWKQPAQWMYYHLLDGDWASNALSWQWVCGANSNKKYFANQENINKYTHTQQKGSYLDVSYNEIEYQKVPKELKATLNLELKTDLPEATSIVIDKKSPTFIYNSYQLDPEWHSPEKGNRILLLEPSHFEKFPISKRVLDFIIDLSKNIEGIQLFVGEFDELKAALGCAEIYFKEHPAFKHYKGNRESRDWISNISGDCHSFFKFWKLVKKDLKKDLETIL